MVLDRWLDALDNVVHADGKKLAVLALASMLTASVPYVVLFWCGIVRMLLLQILFGACCNTKMCFS